MHLLYSKVELFVIVWYRIIIYTINIGRFENQLINLNEPQINLQFINTASVNVINLNKQEAWNEKYWLILIKMKLDCTFLALFTIIYVGLVICTILLLLARFIYVDT